MPVQTGSTVAMYVKGGGTPTVTSGVLGLPAARITVGALAPTVTTGMTSPGGTFDIIGKTCTLNITYAAAGTGAGRFQVFVDNNTTTATNSIHGAASQVVLVSPASGIVAGTVPYTFSLPVPAAGYTAGQGSFLMFRTESTSAVSIESFSLSCI